jgi:hypothetical protein
VNWTERKDVLWWLIASTLGNAAAVVLSVVEPFTIGSGKTLTIEIDGTTRTVTFPAMTNATAAQVVAVIGAGSDVYGTKVRLRSALPCGTDSRVHVVSGDANVALQFPTSLSQGNGLSSSMLIWAKEAQPYIGQVEHGRIALDVISDRQITPVMIIPSVAGLTTSQQRVLALSIQAECLSHVGEQFAFRWLSQIQHWLQRERTRLYMREQNIAIYGQSDVLVMPNFRVDDREYSKANFDLRLGYVVERIDESFSGDWIETIEITSPWLSDEQNPMVVP